MAPSKEPIRINPFDKMNQSELTSMVTDRSLSIRFSSAFKMATKSLLLFTKAGNIKHGFISSVNNSYVNVRQKHYDIAIAGGGMVGNAMACALGK